MTSEIIKGLPDRLRQCAKVVGSGDELSRLTGINRRTLEYYLSGNSEPKFSKIIDIAMAAKVSLEWLAHGEGLMLNDTDSSLEDIIKIPHYDAQLAAGAGSFNHDAKIISHIPMYRPLLERLAGKENVKDLVFLDVRGDSMSPIISNGDMALIDLKNKTIREDIMAFVFEDECYIKRIRKMFNGVDIISVNKDDFPPYHIDRERMDQFHVIGKVLSIYHVF